MVKQDSYLRVSRNGTITYVGPAATQLYAAKVIRIGLRAWIKTGIPVNQAYTPRNMLIRIEQITGRRFPNSNPGHASALVALTDWIDAEEAKLPVRREE